MELSMRNRSHRKAQQKDMETRSRKLRDRPFIAFQCAVFAVLILCGALRAMEQNVSAVTGQGVAAGIHGTRRIAKFSDRNGAGARDAPQKSSLPLQTIVLYGDGALCPETLSPGSRSPSWNQTRLDDFGRDGLRDTFRNDCATGNVAVLHAPILISQELDPFAVRAPPSFAVRCFHRSGDVFPHIKGGAILPLRLTSHSFPGGAHRGPISSSLYIRAPPMVQT